tara:strand:- start:4229 stop:4690 length:462 start_codon:yes stop_codon:yes gene_type:complete
VSSNNRKRFFLNPGFTLIELLVVVAILGILASVGIVAYSGYTASTKIKSAQNIMQQISLAQTEYYSDQGSYYTQGDNCVSTSTKGEENTEDLTKKLGVSIPSEIEFLFCSEKHDKNGNYNLVATSQTIKKTKNCELQFNSVDKVTKKTSEDDC